LSLYAGAVVPEDVNLFFFSSRLIISVIQGTFGMIQRTFGVIQGTFGMIQRTFGVIQGTFGVIQGTFGVISCRMSICSSFGPSYCQVTHIETT
jgi:uncharacterized membrane protein